MPSGGRRLPPWTSPRSAEVSRWSPCTPAAAAAGSGHVTPASGCSRPPRVPSVESPYVRAKQAQLVEKDPNKAIPLFWAAINSGDRIESALKDMATVLKQANRTEEAIEAIRSFRHRCPDEAQESLDNILLDLYKKCGRTEEQIEMLTVKLRIVDEELVSGRWKTKLSRSQGRTTYVSLKDEKARLLGNLAWAYMQSENYEEAEMLYRQALVIEADYNKECNLAICLMKTGKIAKARCLLEAIPCSNSSDESHVKSFARATEMLIELESQALPSPVTQLKCKEPWVLLAADVKKLEELEPPTLYTPMTQLKHKEPQISVAADEENHRNFNSGALPSPVTQLKRKEQQILIASGGEKHQDCDDEYSDFSRFFNDAATPQSILEKLRKRLVKEEIPNADGTAVASSWNPMQGEVSSANVVRKTWADMVEEEEQQSHHSNSTVGVTYIEQKESSKHTSEQKYRTPSDSSKESSTLQRPTTGCMLSSSSAGLWRHNDSKIFSEKRRTWADMVEEEQQMDESSKHESEHKYRTPSASSHESSTLQRTIAGPRPPSYSAGSWRHNETRIFADENVNWKFVRSTPTWKQQKWQDHSNRVCQRLNMIRLNEKPQDTFRAPWRNGTAQRSLFSDWKSNSDGSGSASMPFGKKEHCQGSSYIEATNSWPNHVPSMRPWRSQNRLRVFQEITNDVKRSAV